jgi:hypothetical protein
MSFLMFNQGEGIAAAALVNKTAPQELDLILYQNNHALADGDTEADYTECDFSGYERKLLTAASWVVTEDAPTELEYPEQSFTSDSDQTAQLVYGYLLLQRTSGKAICGWRFDDGPYSISLNNDAIDITPNILLKKPSEV